MLAPGQILMVGDQTMDFTVAWLLGWLVDSHLPADAATQGVIALYAALFVTGLCALCGIGLYLLPRGHYWPPKAEQLRHRPWRVGDVALIVATLVLLQAIALTAMLVLRRWGRFAVVDSQQAWIIIHSIALHWSALACVGWAIHLKRVSWAHAFGAFQRRPWWIRVGQACCIYAATMPLLMVLTIAYQWWLEATGYTPTPQDVVLLFSELERGWMYAYFIFLAIVLAPVSEELLFRGILLPALAKRFGLCAAILVQTALFALLHLHIPSLIPLLVLSVTLSLAYLYTASIFVPIIMHMIFNAISLLAMVLLAA